MKVTTTITLAAAVLAGPAAVYGQATAQTNTSTSSSASAQAGGSGAQVSNSNAASASAQGGQNSAGLSSGTAMNATLSQPVDAKKNKPGDPVAARTNESAKSDGKVVVPKGSKLVGHVTEAKARAKGESESALGIVFDKAILKNGQEIPLNVTVQAIAAAQTTASNSLAGDDLSAGGAMAGGATGRASGGGALGGVRSTAGATTGAVTNTAANVGGATASAAGGAINSTTNVAGATHGATGGLNAAGHLTSNSQGVFGLDGINLNSAASSSTQGSLITSTSKNVHLDSGTQLLLVAQGQAAASGSKQ
jgi:hypothetical protein